MSAIPIIRLLLEATQRGKIRWRRNKQNADLYEAELGGETLSVRFVRFARTDGLPPSRHVAELEAFGVTTDHAVGSEGMELLNQMLAFCDLEWTAMRQAIRDRLMEAERLMHLVLEPAPAVLPNRKQRATASRKVRVKRERVRGRRPFRT